MKIKFEKKKAFIISCVELINKKYQENIVDLELKDQYFNMKEKILPVYHIIDLAAQAIGETGVEPLIIPIRGGTDGARLTFMGVPTPNLFDGSMNFHGKKEWVPLEWMDAAVETLLHLMDVWVERNRN